MPTVNISGVNVAYGDSGKGETMVMLHCSASSGSQWKALQGAIGNNYRYITPDLFDCGKTDPWPGRETLTLAAEAAIVNGLIARFPGPLNIVGHSYGAAIALRYAATTQHRIKSLTLIEPVAFQLLRMAGKAEKKNLDEITEIANQLCLGLMNGDEWQAMGRFVDYWNGESTWINLPWDTRRKMAPRVRATARHFWSTIREPLGTDTYHSIRIPTTIISGGCTRQPTRRIAEILASVIPDANHRVLENGAHMLPMSHPELVALAMPGEFASKSAKAPSPPRGERVLHAA